MRFLSLCCAWQVADTSAKYTTVTNKGNEATPYLQYIIDNYDNLPETILFSHGHKCGWPARCFQQRCLSGCPLAPPAHVYACCFWQMWMRPGC